MAGLTLAVATALVCILYFINLAVYRLFLSPIARIPGPKLAALSFWYEAYFEIVKKGQFSFHITDLHKQYGPIVRVTPDEVHIFDPTFWETLYVKYNRSSKYERVSGRFGMSNSVFTTADSNLHRVRRGALNNHFSRRAILGFEPVVQQKMGILVKGLNKFKETGGICTISEAYSAFAGDVVNNYAFGFDHNHLDLDGFPESLHGAFKASGEFCHVALQFPWMLPLLNSLPDSWNQAMNPPFTNLLKLRRDLLATIADVKQKTEEGEKKPAYPTIFHAVIQSDLPESEKSDRRLAEEAQLILGAGVETTSWALCQATYYILADPVVLKKLKKELREAIPNQGQPEAWEFARLEGLPYLRGCIKEGIRLGLSVSARNHRVLDQPLTWRDWVIPAGTPISMTISDVHLNNDYFPDATSFKPERWIGENARAPDGSPLERYFVAFGKGPRQCLGINLAYMELYIALATIFRKFEMELYETDLTDVITAHDFFIPFPKPDSKGIRIKVTGSES